MQPQISVIVPVYKTEKYLRRCIDSILSQTFTDFELILVDDGSPDSSGAICDEYAKKDKRIKVIHKENKGVNSARREGFIYSNGRYIVFLDSDDTLTNNAIKILYNNIIKGYDIVKGGIARVNDSEEIIRIENFKTSEECIEGKENIISKIYSGEIAPYLCGAIYKRELFTTEIFEKCIEFKLPYGEDWIINLIIAKKTNQILCIKDIIYNYYINEESMTSSNVISLDYYNRQNKLLQDEGFFNIQYLKNSIEYRKFRINIKSFFIPELNFNTKVYKETLTILRNKEVKNIIKERTNKNYLYFINNLIIFYIYSRLYCLLYYIIRLHCRSRKVLK